MKKLIRNLLFMLMVVLIVVVPINVDARENDNGARIHFITIDENSLSVLVECNGQFGMIDSGEDTEYPTGEDPRYPYRTGIDTIDGFEDQVIEYLYSVGVTKDNFEFYIGTHPHSDHIGSADEIIREFCPKRVYTPEYHDYYINTPNFLFDNLFVYDEMLEAAEEVGADIILNFNPDAPLVPDQTGFLADEDAYDYYANEPAKEGKYEHISKERNTVGNPNFTLGGEMKIEIKNYKDNASLAPFGDANRMSLGVIVEANGKKAYVAGDIENDAGDEDRLIGELPSVDIYCMGHHGFLQANSYDFVQHLSPKFAVLPGDFTNIAEVKRDSSRSSIYTVFEEWAKKGVPVYPTAQYSNHVPALVFNFNERLTNNIPKNVRCLGKFRWSDTYFSYKDGFPSVYTGELSYKQHKASFDNSFVAGEGCLVYGLEHWKYLLVDGTYATGWVNYNGNYYYADQDGNMVTGWNVIDDTTYYFDENAVMQIEWKLINDVWYHFSGSGAMQTGWNLINDLWYYFDESGAMQRGWSMINDVWYHFNESGAMQRGWSMINDIWYHFDESGAMQTGWGMINDIWYYFDESGAMQRGWSMINDIWYHFNESGAMQRGWDYIGDTWYHFSESGAMDIGWNQMGDIWYHFSESGAMQTGWKEIGNVWYYFYDDGHMASNTTIEGCRLNSNGAWIR